MSYGYYWSKPGESLLYSVDMSQLVHMREYGFSNREIAEKLGVSYQTILKYLGPQRKRKEN